jgi:putative two-component system response regulator
VISIVNMLPKTYPAHNLSILLVEDNGFERSAISDFLLSRGMTVDTVANGREALGIMNGNGYDLVITDILMPEMDGIEMLRQLRKRSPDLPVIIITSSTDIKHAIEALRLSVIDYLLKPLDFKELETRITLSLMKIEADRRERAGKFQMVEKVIEQEKKLENTFLYAVRTLINAIEARDQYTKGHSVRVTRLVDLFMRKLEIDSSLIPDIILASQLHDTGKLGISDQILHKPSGLSSDEQHIMRTHPEVGYQILKPILPEECLKGILHHHERWDGEGYPMNLSGKSIPIAARIITIADAYDAMITDRKYRPAVAVTDALEEIERRSGTQFDPELVPPFVEVIRKHNPLGI